MEAVEKIRSNIYLDIDLKEKARSMFKEYGLSLSDGINMLLKQATDTKNIIIDLNFEPVFQADDDYKKIQETKKDKIYHLSELLKL